jgi:hypothetical protein
VTDWLVGRCQCAGNQEAVKEVARNFGRLGVLRDSWYEASEPVIQVVIHLYLVNTFT